MSVYYNQDTAKNKENDKKQHDLIKLSGGTPPDGGLHP
jgi:hypothetical protein